MTIGNSTATVSFSIYINTVVRLKNPQETLKMKYSSWSTGDKSTVINPLVRLPYSVLLSIKLDALKQVMNIPHDAYWPSFTFEGQVICYILNF